MNLNNDSPLLLSFDKIVAVSEEVKKAFDQNGIKIPHNQLDVNIKEK